MYFSYHDFVEISDQMLEKIQFSKTHYRIIYFLGKNDFITIKELLSILKITKQSISRIINQLVKEKYIILSTGSDKRTKKLTLTEKGMKLEKKLTELQITKIRNILLNANESDINSFKKILYSMTDPYSKKIFNKINE